ncbi:MAG: tetratricopeptide repeat protein, partial [Verrucomicrobiota bacterium]
MNAKTPALITVLLLTMTGLAFAAESATETFQKGLFEEEGNHDLAAAIQAYQTVISQFDEQRKTAANAIFRLGECYRKQGKTNEA